MIEHGHPPRGTPKNYLVAWLLAVLKGHDMHGYEITKTLRERFGVDCDAGTVYRILRHLESDGCIQSQWQVQAHGPVKRVYTLTELGMVRLNEWHLALSRYRETLDAFFLLAGQPSTTFEESE